MHVGPLFPQSMERTAGGTLGETAVAIRLLEDHHLQ